MRVWFSIIALVALTAPVIAEEPAAADLKLLETLRADDFDARESARDKLIARGDSVRGLVGAELEKENLDVDYKACLKAVMAGLREQEALKPFDAPRRISVDLEEETVGSALRVISAHFKQPVVTRDDATSSAGITLSLKDATFIEAVNAVRRAAGLDFDPPYAARHSSVAPEKYAKLALAKHPNGAPEVSAAKGPFAVTLSRVQQQDTEGRPPYMMVSGALYFEKSARFSRIKVASLTALGPDKKEYVIAPPVVAPTALRVYRIWCGQNATSGSFTLVFDATFRFAEKIPPGLNWKLNLGVEIPTKISEERIEILESMADTPQELRDGLVSFGKATRVDDEWSIVCDITGDAYLGLQPARSEFSPMTEGPPGSAGLGYPALIFLDENGAEIAYRALNRNFNREPSGVRKAQFNFKLSARPRSMVFTRTLKSATREYEMEIPAVPVPFGEALPVPSPTRIMVR